CTSSQTGLPTMATPLTRVGTTANERNSGYASAPHCCDRRHGGADPRGVLGRLAYSGGDDADDQLLDDHNDHDDHDDLHVANHDDDGEERDGEGSAGAHDRDHRQAPYRDAATGPGGPAARRNADPDGHERPRRRAARSRLRGGGPG